MSKDTKIVHFVVIDGNDLQIKALAIALSEMRERLQEKVDFNIEFLITNDKYQLRDVKYLINELYKLYKMERKLREKPLEKSEEDKKE